MQASTRLPLVAHPMLSSSPSGIGGIGGSTRPRVSPLSAQISAAAPGSASVGVIIHSVTQESGYFHYIIKDLVPGGPADCSQLLRRGDVLVSVDYHPVDNVPLESIVSLITGDEGTVVEMTMRRHRPVQTKAVTGGSAVEGEGGGGGETASISYSVALQRSRMYNS